ncbi:MAG: hypothetical protein V1754_11830 [Pseudomonadota bacterium]
MKQSQKWFLPMSAVVLLCSCGFTVTNERPTYDELDPEEKDAIATVLAELNAFNGQVKARTEFNIDSVVDRNRIHVSFEGLIFSANLGDNTIHVATWENLRPAQKLLVQQWFAASTADETKEKYEKFFYQFMAVSQGAKQYAYEVLTPKWVLARRSIFNFERDSIRAALSHYVAEDRQNEMWGFLSTTCKPVLDQYGAQYSQNFNKKYLQAHLPELIHSDNPTGYMYFICGWIENGKADWVNLTAELEWIADLPNTDT